MVFVFFVVKLSVHQRNHLLREPLHLLVLRAELQQQQVDARLLELEDPLGDLLGRAHQPARSPRFDTE